jgi:hypothetical protein
MEALTKIAMKIREQLDLITMKLEQTKIHWDKDDHFTQEVANEKKKHVAQESRK